ncbi:hypothetical protein AB0J71_46475 [Nonomuraea sp. NPDC049637]|uniref:hypothetical protein n=1 Tax=Nonomuraea sp. NPDC049637 TaxID=3154356 RepID=UPI003433AE6A
MGESRWFAWCFDHGRLHTFVPTPQHPDGAWCNAAWLKLAGESEAAALADKDRRFGQARFFDELPDETQLQVLRETDPRQAR